MISVMRDILLDEAIREIKKARYSDPAINIIIARAIGYGDSSTVIPPNWVGDIYAALTLLPNNHVWSVGWDDGYYATCHAKIRHSVAPLRHRGFTIPLALSLAILSAMRSH